VGAPQRFVGTLLFPSSERAAAAVLALPGHAAKVALDRSTLKRRGAQVDVDFENVIGAAFFAPTVMALRGLAAGAIAGSIWAVYNWGAENKAERESHTIAAGLPLPGLAKKPTSGVERAVRCSLLDSSPAEVAYAAEKLEARDVAGVAAIFDALAEPIQKARMARTLLLRSEAEAKRVLREVAAMPIDPDDPWAEQLRAIQADAANRVSRPPRTARAAASPAPATARGAARRPSPRRAPAKPPRARRT
jgi:hypothetical protein